jgi:hypothetical protein
LANKNYWPSFLENFLKDSKSLQPKNPTTYHLLHFLT